jgi:hypothetical protein
MKFGIVLHRTALIEMHIELEAENEEHARQLALTRGFPEARRVVVEQSAPDVIRVEPVE